ncbi:N(4)-(beta-N-acetylglucosaminyl)-L-asparaginase [Schleiferilactobacillus shenzhenensis]|uniref:L-asparaginase n=1 Tax=Schleiferilactobacillus shenzhenensis LY-73 TaxID=1231336 RepID=U4TNC1_9LACO|nr:N(4)-(beta-N-acetylglucosaminyl)-L-asparaginase [Schleiferilactobacillus shenzhenensis]ERL64915.1 L-asparaginase [Schleiferilactobacillus shenzhenensis LY-73]
MTIAMIGTWRMAETGITPAMAQLRQGKSAGDALVTAIQAVEDDPFYQSVGFGGLPNAAGVVETDAAYMDGDTFQIGALAGARDIAHPIAVARALSQEPANNLLVGPGATEYASTHGFPLKNMLTEKAAKQWAAKRQELTAKDLNPYDGHDTVGMVALDAGGHMTVGTSTSGLFMKRTGRVGDSPLPGAGYYVDSTIGGAAATGMGEDLMKASLCYQTVQLMGNGLSASEALREAVYPFIARLAALGQHPREFSYVALSPSGDWGIATNVEFSFAVAQDDGKTQIYLATPNGDHPDIQPVTAAWLAKEDAGR